MSATTLSDPAPRLGPLERLEALCDPGSLRVLRSLARSSRLGDRAIAGDGVVGATGAVNGRPIACYAQNGAFLGGSLGERHADTIVRVLSLAQRARIPVVGFVESGGARMQEGTAALAGYGRIFRETVALNGVVPQISVVSGASAGGGAYSPALTDLIVMTEDAAMFLTGPGVVREALGEEIDAAGLGGPHVHDRNGVCHLVERDEASAAARVRELLGYLPSSAGQAPPRATVTAPAAPDPAAFVPAASRSAYDIRTALSAIIDDGSLLELCPRWARNMVTALARLDGRPIGIVANQPRYLGGVLDAEASEKAARFVNFCNAFGVPLIAFVDTPGFMPGSKQEQAGVIRHGASLVRAFAAARVPKLTVVLRKSYGGAYITMNSRDLGADLVLAWPDAELGIMGARAAVGIVNRRELRAAEDPEAERDRLADVYAEEHLRAQSAAAEGFVDEIIEPVETRDRLAWALRSFSAGVGETGFDAALLDAQLLSTPPIP
ncbi:MAG: carboxyl transferase domain-containing protein [Solirubrobacteraceae bacterium]